MATSPRKVGRGKTSATARRKSGTAKAGAKGRRPRAGKGRAGEKLLLAPRGAQSAAATARALAQETGRPVYRVDLRQVMSSYLGETEKNLEAAFSAAREQEAVLLLDEGDALFGERTVVKDSHDRYANQETNFLLQRIEAFEGVVVLSTNRKSSIDPAFLRRLRWSALPTEITAPLPKVQRTKVRVSRVRKLDTPRGQQG